MKSLSWWTSRATEIRGLKKIMVSFWVARFVLATQKGTMILTTTHMVFLPQIRRW